MPVLVHRHRLTIFEKLSPIVGDEETEAMLAHFPSSEDAAPVTRQALRAELATQRVSIITWTVTTLIAGLSVGMGVAAAVGAAFGAG